MNDKNNLTKLSELSENFLYSTNIDTQLINLVKLTSEICRINLDKFDAMNNAQDIAASITEFVDELDTVYKFSNNKQCISKEVLVVLLAYWYDYIRVGNIPNRSYALELPFIILKASDKSIGLSISDPEVFYNHMRRLALEGLVEFVWIDKNNNLYSPEDFHKILDITTAKSADKDKAKIRFVTKHKFMPIIQF